MIRHDTTINLFKRKLFGAIIFLAVQEKSYKLHWDRLWQMALTSENRLFAINMFDKIFILDGNRMMMPSLNETSNTYETLHEVDQIGEYTAVKFVTVRIILGHPR